MEGNRCNHNPANPQLTPRHPIRKGKGGLPRILSLAAERAKAWYKHPQKCPPLCSSSTRKTRSERREAYQIVIETLLIHLDLASLCLGTPTLDNGFIDVDMKTIVKTSGMGQRRCERAIAQLKKAGLMEVKQPRKLNAQGDYLGCRAIRVVTTTFFEWLGLGPMLQRERARASDALRRKAIKANRKLSDFMSRLKQDFNALKPRRKSSNDEAVQWNKTWAGFIKGGLDVKEAQRRTNNALGYPASYSPGQAMEY